MKRKPSKIKFFKHMSKEYQEKYDDIQGYNFLVDIINGQTDEEFLSELQGLVDMDKDLRRIHRNVLAENGFELTPLQLQQRISIVEYALKYIYSSS